MSYTKLATTCRPCDDGDCPTIHLDDATGDVVIQGYTGPGPNVPAGEGTVRMSRTEWDTLLTRLGR